MFLFKQSKADSSKSTKVRINCYNDILFAFQLNRLLNFLYNETAICRHS